MLPQTSSRKLTAVVKSLRAQFAVTHASISVPHIQSSELSAGVQLPTTHSFRQEGYSWPQTIIAGSAIPIIETNFILNITVVKNDVE
jgi:hypothetical protein